MIPDGVDMDKVMSIATAVNLGRDLINTPANDLGPVELEQAAETLAQAHGGLVKSIKGDDLLEENLPLIHAVGPCQ